jgi:2',3'-cyclic-nucleotide 2'-phosphodiesterase (5'-nucleotidase family)
MPVKPCTTVAASALLVLSLGLSRAALAEPQTAVRVLASAGLRGRLGEPLCRDGRTVEPHPAAAFLAPLAEAGAAPEAVVVDTGGLLNPHGVSRFVAREQPALLAAVARELGYDMLALGEDDLGAPRGRVTELARQLAGDGIQYVANNLSCADAARGLCDVVLDASDPALLRAVGGEQVALLALVDPRVLQHIAPDRAEGLSLTPIAAALPALVRGARASGATLVVAVLDLDAEAALALPRSLPQDARPDLILLPDAGADLLFARPATVTPAIAAPSPGSGLAIRVARTAPPATLDLDGRADALRGGLDLVATPLAPAEGAVAKPVAAFVAAVGASYCAAFDTPVAGGRLDLARPLDAAAMAELSARILREHADADVAILNPAAVSHGFKPADPRELTASDLYVALEYDEPLVVADVPPEWLLKLRQARAAGLLTPGLGDKAPDPARVALEHLRVRGRRVVEDATYRVVTIRFLAAGGDGALPPLPPDVTWEPVDHRAEGGEVRYRSLRDAALEVLGRSSERDPRDVREDPDASPEWVVSAQVDGDFAGATVSNPDGHEAALLSTKTAASLGGDLTLAASATSPRFSWENSFFGTFRTQYTPGSGDAEGGFVEANDQLQLRSMASWRGLREDPRDVWIPDPYLEVFVESELTRPETRDWHWLLLRPTLGARFPVTDKLELKVQGGFQATPLDPEGEIEAGLGLIVNLRPLVLSGTMKEGLRIDGQLDFFWLDLFDEDRWQARGQFNLVLDLGGPFGFVFGTVWYAQDDPVRAIGLALTATAGIRLGAVSRAVPR